jgi:hypothetical protein
MNRLILSCLFVVSMCGCASKKFSSPGNATVVDQQPQHMYAPSEIKWQPGPPSLLPGAQMAILEGDPSQAGFFAMRLRFPDWLQSHAALASEAGARDDHLRHAQPRAWRIRTMPS